MRSAILLLLGFSLLALIANGEARSIKVNIQNLRQTEKNLLEKRELLQRQIQNEADPREREQDQAQLKRTEQRLNAVRQRIEQLEDADNSNAGRFGK
ncbi:hypothetical protein Ddc_07547 [Ditylenchus destructor]|nr:hypothetical protein Ddc_07547 [Ditylenchus destructor]